MAVGYLQVHSSSTLFKYTLLKAQGMKCLSPFTDSSINLKQCTRHKCSLWSQFVAKATHLILANFLLMLLCTTRGNAVKQQAPKSLLNDWILQHYSSISCSCVNTCRQWCCVCVCVCVCLFVCLFVCLIMKWAYISIYIDMLCLWLGYSKKKASCA